jgi:hypothetical protein
MKWSEVEGNPKYQSATPEQQQKIRDGFFNDVIAPNVPKEANLDDVKNSFYSKTAPKVEEKGFFGKVGDAISDVFDNRTLSEKGLLKPEKLNADPNKASNKVPGVPLRETYVNKLVQQDRVAPKSIDAMQSMDNSAVSRAASAVIEERPQHEQFNQDVAQSLNADTTPALPFDERMKLKREAKSKIFFDTLQNADESTGGYDKALQIADNANPSPEQLAAASYDIDREKQLQQDYGNIEKPKGLDVPINAAGRAMKQGSSLAQGMIALGSKIVGADDFALEMIKSAVKTSDEANKYPAQIENFTKIKSLSDVPTYVLEGVIENAGMLIGSIGAGAIGAKIGEKTLGKQAIANLTQDAIKKELAKRSAIGAASGAAASSIGMESGSIYNDIYQATGQERPLLAVGGGMIAGSLDAIPATRALKTALGNRIGEEAAKTIVQRYGIDGLKQISEEGATEFAQTWVEEATKAQATGEDVFTSDNMINALDAMFKGGAAGGVTHVAAQGFNDFTSRTPKTRGQRIIEELKRRQWAAQQANKPIQTPLSATSASVSENTQNDTDLLNQINASEAINASDILGPEQLSQEVSNNANNAAEQQDIPLVDETTQGASDNVEGSAGSELSSEIRPTESSLSDNATTPRQSDGSNLYDGVGSSDSGNAVGEAKSTIDAKAHEASTSPLNDLPEPTQAQKDAGNYKVGRIKVSGLDISVENPHQSKRSGIDRDGKAWQSDMNGHYGYVKGVVARAPDKEHVDVNVKPSTPDNYDGDVFVINQNHPDTGKFDEPKVYIGYSNEQEARDAYASNYADDWKGLDSVAKVPMAKFKEMLNDKKAFLKPIVESKQQSTPALSDLEQRVSEVFKKKLKYGNPIDGVSRLTWEEQNKEQIENPNRYHKVEEVENPKNLKIGDYVNTSNGGSGWVTAITKDDRDKSNVKFSANVSEINSYGGWSNIDSLTKIPEPDFGSSVSKTVTKTIKKSPSKSPSTLLGALRAQGGISLADKLDVTGQDKSFAPGGYNQVFKRDATQSLKGHIESGSLDEYLPNDMRLSSNGMQDEAFDSTPAYDYLSARIRNGEKVLPFDVEQEVKSNKYYQDANMQSDIQNDVLSDNEINTLLSEAGYDERQTESESRVYEGSHNKANQVTEQASAAINAIGNAGTQTREQPTQAQNEVATTPRGDGKRGEREGVRPLVEAIVKRRAAANQIGKSKPFDTYLQVANDFMAMTMQDTPNGEGYDRIIMNPPFSDRRDMQHVQHAYSLLKPNGRVVAIVGEGVFFGSDKRAIEFREWVDGVGGTSEKLNEGTFLDSSLPVNTSVNARMVVIDKADSDTPLFSRSNSNQSLKDKLQAVIDGDNLAKGKLLTIADNSPASLQIFGFDNLPVVTRTGADGVLKMHYDHGLSVSKLASVIENGLKRPAMILQHKGQGDVDSIRFVTNEMHNGNPVILAIQPDKTNREGERQQLIATAFEVNADTIASAINQGNLLYRDTNANISDKVRKSIVNAQIKYAREPRIVLGVIPKTALIRRQAYKVLSQSDIVKYEKDNAGKFFSRSNEDDPIFKRENTKNSISNTDDLKATTIKSIQSHVDRITNGWVNAPKVNVVFDMSDMRIPENVRNENERQLSQGAQGQPEGFYVGGNAYIVASEMRSIKDVERVLFHEVLGHSGLRGAFGDALKPMLDTIAVGRKKEVVAKAKEYGLNIDNEKDSRIAAEEVLAELAQTKPELGIVKRAIAAIRKWLRDNIPYFKDMQLSDNEVVNSFILPARRFIEKGGKTQSVKDMVMAFNRKYDDVSFSKSNQTETESFKKWFGDSKVVDEHGRPLVVYHGTNKTENGNAFNSFDTYSSAKYGLMGQGSYFTDNSNIAGEYTTKGKGESPSIYSLYLSIKNPIDMDAKANPSEWMEAFNDDDYSIEDYHSGGTSNESWYRAAEEMVMDMSVPSYEGADIMQGGLRSMGYDGITHVGGGRHVDSKGVKHKVYVAFESEQIKSAIGNTGSFSPNNDSILFSRGQQRLQPEWESLNDSTLLDDLVYKFQDKHKDLKDVIKAIKNTGTEIADRFNTYLQEELYHGRVAKRTQDFIESELEPLLKKLSDSGIPMADFEHYLWARHAEERNAQIAKVNPDMPDGGSGLTNAEAKAYLSGIDDNAKANLEKIADMVDAINKRSRQLLVEYGIEDMDTAMKMESAYQHYVPLMRDEMEKGFGGGTGQGFSIKGNSTKRAMGSNKAVVDILANIAQQREKFIVRGEKNRVATALVGLAKLNPNDEFWKVDTPPTIRFINKTTGLVDEMTDPSYKSRDNVVIARILDKNGKVQERSVVFNEYDKRAARMAVSLKNLDMDGMEEWVGRIGTITRYFASVNTQYNPLFGVVNIMRDVQSAALNLSSTPLANDKVEVLAQTGSALKGIYQVLRGSRKGKEVHNRWADLWEEFQREGGQTGYRELFRTTKDRADNLNKVVDPTWWRKTKWGKVVSLNNEYLANAEQFAASSVGKPLFDWLEDYNDTLENSVRLSAYKVALDKGLSKQQAASLAKNLTVNFNRKGASGARMGAFYAFFNASVQGTARIGETMFKDGKLSLAGKRIISGGVMLGIIQALALSGFDDDDPPQFERDRNMIIPIGDHKYIKIPMPLGFHVIPSTSRILTEYIMNGGKQTPEMIAHLGSLFADSFNPVGGSSSLTQILSPTVTDPIVSISENQDFAGRQIYQKDFNSLDPTPGFKRAKDTATKVSTFLAEIINKVSGGTDYQPGIVSPTPDQIDYLIGQAFGGVGREAMKIENFATSSIDGTDLPTYKIPLVGKFYGNTKQQSSEGAAFYRNIEAMNRHENEIKGRMKDGKETQSYIADNPSAVLWRQAKFSYSVVQKLRKRQRNMIDSGAEKEAVVAINNQITQAMKRFNDIVSAKERPLENVE